MIRNYYIVAPSGCGDVVLGRMRGEELDVIRRFHRHHPRQGTRLTIVRYFYFRDGDVMRAFRSDVRVPGSVRHYVPIAVAGLPDWHGRTVNPRFSLENGGFYP